MKKLTIAIHTLPTELLDFRRLISDLYSSILFIKTNSYLLTNYIDIEIYATLNISEKLMNFVDKSIFVKYYFDTFDEFKNSLNLKFNLSDDIYISGTTAQKRHIINTDNESDYFIFVDPDIYFPTRLLYYMIISEQYISDDVDMFVISPSTVKLWDDSWDCLVNTNFLNNNYTFYKTYDPTKVYAQGYERIELTELRTFKFGCGMHTLYSKKFVKKIGIPDSFGDYGSEDTYMMECAKLLKKSGANIKQYLLNGIFIAEDYVYNRVFNDNLVEYTLSRNTVKTHESLNFSNEIDNFIKYKLYD